MIQFKCELEKWNDAISIDRSSRDCGIDSMLPVCYTTKRNNKYFF